MVHVSAAGQATAAQHALSRRDVPWVAALAGGALLSVVYFAIPTGWPQSIAYEAIGAGAVVAVAAGVMLHRPRWWRAWVLIGLGQALFVLADLAFTLYEQLTGDIPVPSVADVLYICGYLVLAIGVVRLIRARDQGRDRSASIDALIVASAFGLVTWLAFIEPLAVDAELALAERIVYVSYPAMDVLLIGISARLLAGQSRFPADWLLLASLLFTLAGDVAYAMPWVAAGYASGHPVDLFWLLGYVCLAGAALHPSMAAAPAASSDVLVAITWLRMAVLGLSLLLGPLLLLLTATGLIAVHPALVGLVSTVTAVLVVIRLSDLTTALQQSERRFVALIQNATDAHAVLRADGTHAYLSPAVTRILGFEPAELIGVEFVARVHPDDRAWAQETIEAVASAPGSERAGSIRLRRADGSWVVVETVVKNLLDEPAVTGIVVNYRDVTERTRLEDELRHQALHDALTGLPNRALFLDRLRHALAGRDRPIAVLFLDLDNFKAVNDRLGHAAGDELLRTTARRLRTALREGDTVARMGGDEFAILLTVRVDRTVAKKIAVRIIRAIAAPLLLEGEAIEQQVSVGIVAVDHGQQPSDPEAILRDADVAMYQAKLAGKGTHAFFSPDMPLRVPSAR